MKPKLNLYHVDVRLAGTIYVKAASAAEAWRKAREFANYGFELPSDDLIVSGRRFDDPKLPNIFLSPVMTGHGLYGGKRATMSLSHPDVPASEEES